MEMIPISGVWLTLGTKKEEKNNIWTFVYVWKVLFLKDKQNQLKAV